MGEQTQRNQEGESGHEGFQDGNISHLRCEVAAPNHPPQCLLQRVERLDLIMSAMEEKAPTEPSSTPSTSPRSKRHSSLPSTPSGLQRRRKPTVSVLEEVQEKGTLVERVSDLEKRLIMLQQTLCSKSTENVTYPGALHLNLPHRRVASHLDGYDHPFLQDPIDVEKHEVTRSRSARLPKHESGHPEPSPESESLDTHSTRSESPHVEHCEVVKASADEEQNPRAPHPQSKKKRWRIRKWLSKQFNIHFPRHSQGKLPCSTGHCGWGRQIHPKNCWNIKKKDMNSSLYTQYCHMPIDEGVHDCRERV